MRGRLLALLALGATASTAARAQQGGGRCDIELTQASDSSPLRLTTNTSTPNGPRNVFVGGRVAAKCLRQDVRLLADSAEWYQNAQVLYLIGNVRYTEPRVRVTSNQMSYFQADERLLATGNVEATLPSGSIMRGPQATYYRAIKGLRPAAKLEAVQRPRLWLSQRDSTGKQGEPVQVTANQITTDNDSLVYAGGKVEITRSDLDARSDSAFLDSGNELARLMISPVIIGKGERSYTLRGRQVELYTRDRIVQRVLAQADAKATSDDLLLTADTIDLRVDRNKAQAAYIWGKSRARAVSPDRDLIADSLAVRMPDQQLREIRAFVNAVATTIPDTALIRTGEKDWVKGDTIFAFFDSTSRATRVVSPDRPAATAAPATPPTPVATPTPRRRGAPPVDTATARPVAVVVPVPDSSIADSTNAKPQLREMQAIGHASARYQVQSQGSTPEKPAINYSRGDRITVVLDSLGVSRVDIDENAVGLYLEPTPDTTSVPPSDQLAPTTLAPTTPAPIAPAPIAPVRPTSSPTVVPPRTTKPATRPAAVPPRTSPVRP
jgi:lipopolysaccharide export system protein LptA